MDKIFSTRIDDAIIRLLDELANRFRKTKKEIIEEAIEQYAEKKKDIGFNILKETSGCWQGDEPIEETVKKARKQINEPFSRYHS